jgi:uncharacterized protein (DUF934 family)
MLSLAYLQDEIVENRSPKSSAIGMLLSGSRDTRLLESELDPCPIYLVAVSYPLPLVL